MAEDEFDAEVIKARMEEISKLLSEVENVFVVG